MVNLTDVRPTAGLTLGPRARNRPGGFSVFRVRRLSTAEQAAKRVFSKTVLFTKKHWATLYAHIGDDTYFVLYARVYRVTFVRRPLFVGDGTRSEFFPIFTVIYLLPREVDTYQTIVSEKYMCIRARHVFRERISSPYCCTTITWDRVRAPFDYLTHKYFVIV